MKGLLIRLSQGRVARVESSAPALVGLPVAVRDEGTYDVLRKVRPGLESDITDCILRSRERWQSDRLASIAADASEGFQRIEHARVETAAERYVAIKAELARIEAAADEAMQADSDALDDLELTVVARYGTEPAPSKIVVACDEAQVRLADAAQRGLSGPEYVAEVTDVLEGLRAAVAATLN